MVRKDMPRCVLVNQWQRNQSPDDYTISSSGADSAAATAFVQGVTTPPFTPGPGVTPSSQYLSNQIAVLNASIAALGAAPGSLMPALMPSGAIAENFPRILAGSGDAAMTSGTPYILAGPTIPAGKSVAHVNLYQAATAPSGQTHAWIALLDITGKILAVSADAGSTVWSSGTFTPVSVALAYTPAANVQTLVAICVVATTVPTFRGYSNYAGVVDAWSPKTNGPSTTTAQTTPPAVGTSLGLPSAGASNLPYCFVS
jgi:hypothetical protein